MMQTLHKAHYFVSCRVNCICPGPIATETVKKLLEAVGKTEADGFADIAPHLIMARSASVKASPCTVLDACTAEFECCSKGAVCRHTRVVRFCLMS